jgi:hypothetical protein
MQKGANKMTVLTITDIRKSFCDRGFDLVTAVLLGSEDHDFNELRSLDEKRIVILESSTAQKENPEIGVRCGQLRSLGSAFPFIADIPD